MKKFSFIILVLLFCVSLLSCSSNNNEASSQQKSSLTTEKLNTTIEISENGYVSKVNEICTNYDEYIGATIIIEGCFATESFEGNTYNYVYRTGPGCCGNDGAMCGFEFTYNKEMPEQNEWIKVIGILQKYQENGNTYLNIDASNVEVLTQRGKGTVS